MLLVDVTSKSNVAREWLPDMMDRGLIAARANETQNFFIFIMLSWLNLRFDFDINYIIYFFRREK